MKRFVLATFFCFISISAFGYGSDWSDDENDFDALKSTIWEISFNDKVAVYIFGDTVTTIATGTKYVNWENSDGCSGIVYFGNDPATGIDRYIFTVVYSFDEDETVLAINIDGDSLTGNCYTEISPDTWEQGEINASPAQPSDFGTIFQRLSYNYFNIKTWREAGNIWLEVDPNEGYRYGNIFLCSSSFSVVQNGYQYNNVIIYTSLSSDSYCDYIFTTGLFKLSVSDTGGEWNVKDSFQLFYDYDDTNYLEIPEATLYYLNIIVDPPESGTLDSNDKGYYEQGEEIDITLTPKSGYTFSEWDDGDDSRFKTYVMPPKDSTLTAYLVPTSVSTSDSSISDSGGDSSSGGCFISTSR